MPRDPDRYDFFVSYARKDNATAWISRFVEELQNEHRKFSGGRSLIGFFDTEDIRSLDDWRHRIYHGLAASRLFVAFISPRYLASEWCRREWRAWIDTEIAKHILSSGAALIYVVEVPGLDNGAVREQEVARKVAELCSLPEPYSAFVDEAAAIVKQVRRRQLSAVRPFYQEGLDALRREDLRRVLAGLAKDLDDRAEQVRTAADSETTVPPYNKRFSGRLDELLDLRERLKDDRAGVIAGVHGLGGMGKTELAFTYAHAFASAYPGGRFLVPCEGKSSLRDAALHVGEFFRDRISDGDREHAETYFAAIIACLRERLDRLGHILLVLDNVTNPALLTAQECDALTSLGAKLHLLATTRLGPPAGANWLTLGELSQVEALELLEKHRLFADEAEEVAGRRLVRRLGGFALAVELVAAWLAVHPTVTCASFLERLGLEDLEALDALTEDQDVELRRHNHERRVQSVLGPALADLASVARRAMDYAVLLPPDEVSLVWLRELVTEDFPQLAKPPRPGYVDPWDEVCRSLEALGLMTRGGASGAEIGALVRVHRLVQDLVRRGWSAQESHSRQQALDRLVKRRIAHFELGLNWEKGIQEVGWSQLKLLERFLRHALETDKATVGPDHPNVATHSSDLALVLGATGWTFEAVILLRQALAIFFKYEASTGQRHPNRDKTILNYILSLMDRHPNGEGLTAHVESMAREYGIQLHL